MRKSRIYKLILPGLLVLVLLSGKTVSAQQHPLLLLNEEVVAEMRAGVQQYPVWKAMTDSLLAYAGRILTEPVEVPVPKDPAGGYTHTQHKKNAQNLKQLGLAWLITDDTAYAAYAKKIFLAYAGLYPELGQHPVKNSYAPGKLFWQQLNEAVWLVDAIQGYDAIYTYLSAEERALIEEKLLRPFAAFLSVENPGVFNRIHNHGVWAVAAVGMTGIVLDDDVLLCSALYGIDDKGRPNRTSISRDDPAALTSGFLVQTRSLFSPDGYYTEGPYYQRYAMTPFLLFAQSLELNVPELDIMHYRDGVFLKAVRILIDLSDSQGRYYPINDNLKGMSLYSPESQAALCFLYARTGDAGLLGILREKSITLVDANSLKVAAGLSTWKGEEVVRSSKIIRDGAEGDEGGIALIRDGRDESCVILKFASHGLTHGHFDRLNMFCYRGENEILSDYGSVRFVNIEAKEGGRYLPGNDSYAKQTVAHNTVVVDERSQFGGKYDDAQKTHGELVYADLGDRDVQFVCAREEQAYDGVELLRITGLLRDSALAHPLILDIFRVSAETKKRSFDLPWHFEGDILNTNFRCKPFTERLTALGRSDGYQHLWKIAEGSTELDHASLSWLDNSTIYTLSFAASPATKIFLTRSGAGDPAFDLRTEPALIIRETNKKEHVFAAVLEIHGDQNESTEMVSNQEPSVRSVTTIGTEPGYLAVAFETRKDSYLFLSAGGAGDADTAHVLRIGGKEYKWTGYYKLFNEKK